MKKGDPSAKDFKRWSLWRQGHSPDELAQQWNTSAEEIQRSINAVQSFQQLNSHEAVDIRINQVILNVLNGVGSGTAETILRDLSEAKRMLSSYGPNGEPPILEPDHDTRIRMLDVMMKMVDKVRPRGSGMNVNVNQNNNTLNVTTGGAPRSFEQRVRTIRDKNDLRTIQGEVVADAIDGDGDDDADFEADADSDVDDEDDSLEDSGTESDGSVPEPADVTEITSNHNHHAGPA